MKIRIRYLEIEEIVKQIKLTLQQTHAFGTIFPIIDA